MLYLLEPVDQPKLFKETTVLKVFHLCFAFTEHCSCYFENYFSFSAHKLLLSLVYSFHGNRYKPGGSEAFCKMQVLLLMNGSICLLPVCYSISQHGNRIT